MRLSFSPNSPFVRSVMVMASEVGISDQIETIPTGVWSSEAHVIAFNPLGQIPTLVCDDKRELYVSLVICEYLDARFNEGRLFDGGNNDRFTLMRRPALGNGLINAAIIRALELRRRPPELRWNEIIEHQKTIMRRIYDVLEMEAEMFGQKPDLAQIAIACALDYVDLRCAEDAWHRDRPVLSAWYERMSQRPSFYKTKPP